MAQVRLGVISLDAITTSESGPCRHGISGTFILSAAGCIARGVLGQNLTSDLKCDNFGGGNARIGVVKAKSRIILWLRGALALGSVPVTLGSGTESIPPSAAVSMNSIALPHSLDGPRVWSDVLAIIEFGTTVCDAHC